MPTEQKPNDGEPAFPIFPPADRDTVKLGMSKREYFAAHAPAEPQAWFEPIMPQRPPSNYVGDADGPCPGKEFANAIEAERACGDLFTNIAWEAQAAWDKENARALFVQWPWAWADAVLSARNR